MPDLKTVTFDAIRNAGGVIRGDGSIWFQNVEQFLAAAPTPPAQSADHVAEVRNMVGAQSAGQEAVRLPDGSGFMVASLPLPSDHWLYAPRSTEWDDARDTSADTPHPIISNEQRDAVIAAVRYAVRGATMCGQEMDFDPDALVLNAAYALCGPAGTAAPVNGGEREHASDCAVHNMPAYPNGACDCERSDAQQVGGDEHANRYRVEKASGGFWPNAVRCGTGTRELFVGHKKQCERVAAELKTAFEDGRFVERTAALTSPAKVGDLPTLEALELFAANLAKDGRLTWAGFRKDSDDRHTIPIISPATHKLVCAAIAEWASPAKEQK